MERQGIDIQNLTKYYYSEASVTRVLHNIDLSFGKNGFVAITGESGSGKSTLLKIISGMEEFDEGELFLDGRPASQYGDEDWEQYRREKIGYIFQDYSLIEHYSVRNNIVSTLMIMGLSYRQAVQKADPYLEQVGLKGLERRRASKLSSGQKQRLSIARALAKGTDFIVADEPTGNLDSETGEQIVRLLQELSRDHLVIMVTHNYEQVEPYITRKIRLHDGEVVEDVEIGGRGAGGDDSPSKNGSAGLPENDNRNISVKQDRNIFRQNDKDVSEKQDSDIFGKQSENLSEKQDRDIVEKRSENQSTKQDRKYFHKAASFLAGMNILTQPGMTLLFFVFLMLVSLLSFYFVGEIVVNADERIAMEYDNSAFPGEDRTRIIAKHQDGKPITEQDADAMRAMKHVVQVDQYDNVNDINYYYQKEKDYQIQFGYMYEEDDGDKPDIEFLDNSHFMRSSTCISKKDLAAGRMPEERGEVVLYAPKEDNCLGSSFLCYLRHIPLWGQGEYVQWQFTVVGILREKTEQIFFSPAMCQMLTAMLVPSDYNLYFYYVKEMNKFLGKDSFIPVIGKGLVGDNMKISYYYQVPEDTGWIHGELPRDLKSAFSHRRFLWFHDYLEVIPRNIQTEEQEPVILNGENLDPVICHFSSRSFLAVSEEWFTQYNDMNSYQASVYISSYAKTAEVLQALERAGYEAISTYQTSVREYNAEKVQKRLTHLAVASVVLLVMLVAEVLLLGALMKLRRKDYSVWASMGMERKLMYRIGFYEVGVYLFLTIILAVIVMGYVSTRFSYIHEMWYYYELPGWLGFISYNMVAAVLTVAGFYFKLDFDRNAH